LGLNMPPNYHRRSEFGKLPAIAYMTQAEMAP
jgi:hypothetical protein